MQAYDWPGNIRELQNVVERTLLLAEDSHITFDCLPREIVAAQNGDHEASLNGGYKEIAPIPSLHTNRTTRKAQAGEKEKERILRILDKYGGNVSKTATELGISRNTLYRKMRSYAISN